MPHIYYWEIRYENRNLRYAGEGYDEDGSFIFCG